MPPNGDHGRNAIPWRSHSSTSPLSIGEPYSSESWFCTETRSTIERVSSICSVFALEIPIQRTLPSSWSSLSAPIDSA